MLHRGLLFALTSLATVGVGSSAIARSQQNVAVADAVSERYLVSQVNPDAELDQPLPSPGVQSLQNRLAELGYYTGPIDGVFSPETQSALASFQQDNGLVGTGIVDPLTQQRLADPDGGQLPPEEDPPEPDLQLDSPEAAEGEEAELPVPTEDDPSGEADAESEAIIDSLDPEEAIAEDGADAEADAAETTATGDGDPGDAAASDEGDAGEAEESSLLLVWLGLGLLVLGGVGAAAVAWFAKRSSRRAKANTDNGAEDGIADDVQESSYQPFASSSSAEREQRNGNHVSQPEDTPRAISVRHRSSPLTNPSEPRIAKVNIIDELIQDLQRPDPEVRRKAIWELGQRGNSAAVQPLVSLLSEADSHEQSLILAALSEISTNTLKPMNRAVAIALQNENPEVRKNAIRDLTRIYDSLSQVGRMLGHASVDEDPEVRQTANWAIDQLNHIRLKASDTAALLQESDPSPDRLPEDRSSSRG